MHGGDRRLLLIFALAAGVAFLLPVVGFPAEPLPPEVEAIRVERERQRAALDRIRRKVEALREAEARGASPVPVVSPPKTSDLAGLFNASQLIHSMGFSDDRMH